MRKSFCAATLAASLMVLSAGSAFAAPVGSISMLSSFGTNGFLQPGAAGAPSNLVTGDNNRGLAYNASSNHLYLANKSGSGSISIMNGDTGASLGSLNMTGISGGTFAIDQIAVDGDGAIYATNLTTNSASSPLKVYRWADESSAPVVVYSGDPGASGVRFGDSFTARGSGTNVQLLAGAGGSSNRVAILSGYDSSVGGSQFSAIAPTVTGAAGGAYRLGIVFGNGDSLFGKQTGAGGLGYATFDIANGTAAQQYAYTTPTPSNTVQQSVGPIGVDLTGGYLVGIFTSGTTTTTQQIQLYDMTGADTGTAPALLDIKNYPNAVPNANAVGQIVFGNGRFYALDTNNGIAAFTVAVPEPATLGLTALAGLATLARRRR